MSHIIHAGDCLDPVSGLAILPDGSIDVVLTDPPYSEHVHAKGRRGGKGRAGRGGGAAIMLERPLGFGHLSPEVMRACAFHFARLARRWVAVFSDTESAHLWKEALEEAGLEYVRTSFWHKLGGAPQFTGDRPAVACEAITLCHPAGRKRWNGGGKQGLYSTPIAGAEGQRTQRFHTTQKPLGLMEALVRDFTDAGETILDPFAGSGTTGVAAKRLGRNFIGWERDPDYAAIAERRIRDAREQLDLITAPVAKARQEALL